MATTLRPTSLRTSTLSIVVFFACSYVLAQSPLVVTGATTSVGDISAAVAGTVNPAGVSALVYVEYGTSISYGSAVQMSPFSISGFSDLALTGTLNGLLPTTTYHYRVRADLSGVGYRYGSDMTFTTGPANTSPSVPFVSASSILTTTASLQATVSSGSSQTTVSFEYGLTSDYEASVPTNSTVPASTSNWTSNAQLSGLQPGTTYHYRCKAVNNEGTSYSADQTFVTAEAPVLTTGAPTSVTDLAAELNGTIDPKGVAYTVYAQYGTTTAYGKLRNGSVIFGIVPGAVPCSVNPSDLLPGTTYHYRLMARDIFNASYFGADQTFTTAPAATPPVLGSAYASVSSSQATIAALVLTSLRSGSSPTTVTFQYGLTTSYGSEAVYPSVFPTNTNSDNFPAFVPLANLTPGATYHFRCKAANAQGTVYTSDDTFTLPAGPALITGAATSVTDLAAMLNGTVNTNSLLLEVAFEYGTTTSYGQSQSIPAYQQNTTAAPFNVQLVGLLPGTTYHYRIKAANRWNANEIFYGADATFTTAAAATPPSVGALSAYNVMTHSAMVDCASVFSGSSTTTAVFEYGTTTAYGSSVTYDSTLPASSVQYVATALTGLAAGTVYHVRAVATNAQGTATSADFSFTTLAATPPSVGAVTPLQVRTTAAQVQAANVSAGSTLASVQWEYGLTTAYGSTVAADPASLPADSTYTVTGLFTGLQPATTYHYRCLVTSVEGTATSTDGTFTTSSGPPLPVTGSASSVGDLTAVLTGSASTTTGTLTAFFELGTTTAYGTVFTPDFATVSSATSTPVSALATGLLPSTTYHYRLSVRDVDNNVFSGADMTLTTAAPATAPTIATVNVRSKSANGATLYAYVNSGSSSATVVFQYGTTAAYGSQLTFSTALGTNQYGDFTKELSGLTPSTTYHFRVVATNNEGTGTGADVTFATPALPDVVTGSATNILATTATLGGSYTTHGGSYTVAFDYGTTTAYGLTATPLGLPLGGIGGGFIVIGIGGGGNSPQGISASASVLPQTTYHFRLKLTDPYGNNFFGSDATFTTPAAVEVWRQQHFGATADAGDAADSASPAHDGIPNIMKYALWMNPAERGLQPPVTVQNHDSIPYLSIAFSRNPYAIDITYEVQAADSPSGPWTTVMTILPGGAATGPGFVTENIFALTSNGIVTPIIGIPIGNPFIGNPNVTIVSDTVYARDIVSLNEAPRRFMRLSITRPQP